MSRTYEEIVDSVYYNYLVEDSRILPNMSAERLIEHGHMLSKSQFVEKIKSDPEFSRKWDLKIIEGHHLEPTTEEYGDGLTVTFASRKDWSCVVHGNEIARIYAQ